MSFRVTVLLVTLWWWQFWDVTCLRHLHWVTYICGHQHVAIFTLGLIFEKKLFVLLKWRSVYENSKWKLMHYEIQELNRSLQQYSQWCHQMTTKILTIEIIKDFFLACLTIFDTFISVKWKSIYWYDSS